MPAPEPHPALDELWELLQSRPSALHKRVSALEAWRTNQEERMSQAEDAIAELNTETNSLAERLDAILSRAANLDATTASEIRTVSSRLRGLAADPANPVPAAPVTPTPGDTGGGAPTA